jgi:hypothetical protein
MRPRYPAPNSDDVRVIRARIDADRGPSLLATQVGVSDYTILRAAAGLPIYPMTMRAIRQVCADLTAYGGEGTPPTAA